MEPPAEPRLIKTDPDPFEPFCIAQGYQVGNLIFLSGQAALDLEGNVVGSGDFDLQAEQTLRKVPTSLDHMTPGNQFLMTLVELPIADGVAAHSIIAVRTRGPIEEGNDGVVEYASAHIDEASSEYVVYHSDHSTQSHPETIQEVRRILLEHLEPGD